MAENSFKIQIAQNDVTGGYDLILQVGGIKDKKQAEQFADCLVEWLIVEGDGWKQRYS